MEHDLRVSHKLDLKQEFQLQRLNGICDEIQFTAEWFFDCLEEWIEYDYLVE